MTVLVTHRHPVMLVFCQLLVNCLQNHDSAGMILIGSIDRRTDECAHEWADRRMGNCSLETIGLFVFLIRSKHSAVYALATGTQQPIRTREINFSRRARNTSFSFVKSRY